MMDEARRAPSPRRHSQNSVRRKYLSRKVASALCFTGLFASSRSIPGPWMRAAAFLLLRLSLIHEAGGGGR